MIYRDRSEGWQYAKLSGHNNEDKINQLITNSEEYRSELSERIKIDKIIKSSIGGIRETDVDCILGGKTKSKTDLRLVDCNDLQINISVKKSIGGQVYLISTNRFIQGFSQQFDLDIPEEIKDSLLLFFNGHPEIDEILESQTLHEALTPEILHYQKKHHRLVWRSLEIYNRNQAQNLLDWFRDNIELITKFCFSRGLALNEEDWAMFVWYKNLIEEDNEDVDSIFNIDDLCGRMSENKDFIIVGPRGGGTTILLPFGFVQWHQGQMQFHHNYYKIRGL